MTSENSKYDPVVDGDPRFPHLTPQEADKRCVEFEKAEADFHLRLLEMGTQNA